MKELLTSEALKLYYNEHCLNAVKNAEQNYKHIIDHLDSHFGNLATNIIAPPDVYSYCDKRRSGEIGKRAGDGTLDRELRMLISAIRYAAMRYKVSYDDAVPNITFCFPKPPPAKDVWLTLDEMYHMIDLAKGDKEKKYPRVYIFVMFGFFCGARKDAILKLRVEQIDLHSRIINFNPPGQAQTNKNKPIVPIADELLPLCEWLVNESGYEWVCESPASIRTSFTNLVKRCGFNKNVTPHSMRHTYCTQALQNGVSIWDVAGVTGDDPEMIKERYGHHDPKFLRSAVNFRKGNQNA